MGCFQEWSPLTREDIDPAMVEKLLKIGSVRNYANGSVVYWEDLDNRVFMLLHGKVEAAIVSTNGRKGTLCIHEGRTLLNDAMLIGPYYAVSYTCLSDVKLVVLEQETLEEAGYKDPSILSFIMKDMVIKIQALSFHLAAQTFDDVENRVYFQLINIARTHGVKTEGSCYLIKEPLTHQLIANIVGSTRVRVTQIMKDLMNQGILEKSGEYYMISFNNNKKTYLNENA